MTALGQVNLLKAFFIITLYFQHFLFFILFCLHSTCSSAGTSTGASTTHASAQRPRRRKTRAPGVLEAILTLQVVCVTLRSQVLWLHYS